MPFIVETALILRMLFTLAVQYNVRLRTHWIPGVVNVLPDALSRQYWGIAAAEMYAYRRGQGFEGRSGYLAHMRTL